MKRNFVLLVALALIGCSDKSKIFGSSYDACILQNAVKGGDVEARATAKKICERQFEEEWRGSNPLPIETNASIGYDAGFDQLEIPPSDEMVIDIWNNSRSVTIKRMHAKVTFYNLKNSKNEFVDPIGTFDWNMDVDIAPGEYQRWTGNFDTGKHAPSGTFDARVSPEVIIPHGNPLR